MKRRWQKASVEGLPEGAVFNFFTRWHPVFPASGKPAAHDDAIRLNDGLPILRTENVNQGVHDLVQHGGFVAPRE